MWNRLSEPPHFSNADILIRTTHGVRMKPNPNRVTIESAAANATAISTLYAAGCNSLQECPGDKFAHGDAQKGYAAEIVRLRAKFEELHVKLGPDALSKMRRIAIEFTKTEILEMTNLVEERRSRFTISHLCTLLRLPKRRRISLAKKAIRLSWSVKTLDRYIRIARKDRRAASGRHSHIPEDAQQKLLVLEALTIKWLRFTRLAYPETAVEPHHEMAKRVRHADRAVKSVQNWIAQSLGRDTQGSAK